MISQVLHSTFNTKIRNFPEEIYKFDDTDHLTALMKVLLEDPGVGALRKIQTVARLSESLSGTKFSDLDTFFGVFFNFHRFPEEQYEFDPYSDQLTADEWDEVFVKDAQYRERIRKFFSSFQKGGTSEGLRMAAEAACGYPCDVMEVWRYLSLQDLGVNPGRLPVPSVKEIVIVPKTTNLTPSRRKYILRVLDRLKPANTFVTVDENGLALHDEVEIRHVSSPSEYYEVEKFVTGVDVPPAPPTERYAWVEEAEEVRSGTWAFLSRMGLDESLNGSIVNAEAFNFDDTTYRILPTQPQNAPDVWGPWREVERADSPDNYPDGKYKGESGRYDSQGNYLHAWSSQQEYLAFLSSMVHRLGGQFEVTRWRLPIFIEEGATVNTSVMDSLKRDVPELLSTWYPVEYSPRTLVS